LAEFNLRVFLNLRGVGGQVASIPLSASLLQLELALSLLSCTKEQLYKKINNAKKSF
jgi:hypothetical protein